MTHVPSDWIELTCDECGNAPEPDPDSDMPPSGLILFDDYGLLCNSCVHENLFEGNPCGVLCPECEAYQTYIIGDDPQIDCDQCGHHFHGRENGKPPSNNE